MKLTIVVLLVVAVLALAIRLIVRAWRNARRRLEEEAAAMARADSLFRTAACGSGDAPLPAQLTANALLADRAATYRISANETLVRLGVLQFLAWLAPRLQGAYEPRLVLATGTEALSRLYQEERHGPGQVTAAQILATCGIEIVPQERVSVFNVRCASAYSAYMDELKRRRKIPLVIVDSPRCRRQGLWFGQLGARVIVTDDGATLKVTEDPRQAGIE